MLNHFNKFVLRLFAGNACTHSKVKKKVADFGSKSSYGT